MSYILGIDQSTQGTKAVLVDEAGAIIGRADRSHRQLVNDRGWVSHDLEEIYRNVLESVRDVAAKTGIAKGDIRAVGISNQRETTAVWNKKGEPLNHAVVWQCSRAKEITAGLEAYKELIKRKTGIPLSPFFPAAKMAWLLKHTEAAKHLRQNEICLGTMDSWLIYRLTQGAAFKTDYSNASRTQLFNLEKLCWDEEICRIFGMPMECLPEVCESNSYFGETDFDGFLKEPVPIYGVAGDSHGALFGQGCHRSGMIKATYGTGSSIMMNTGENCIVSRHGLVTSLAWGMEGKVHYVLEGNINYTGAVITWLKDDMKLIESPGETEAAARKANPRDETVLIPAFSGLSMPYWKENAKAMIYGMTRTTGRNELIKAALESISMQIEAVLEAMRRDSGMEISELRVDGGPTRNQYLMQLQSDVSNVRVTVADTEELSALGVAYMAGLGCGMYEKEQLFGEKGRMCYYPQITDEVRREKRQRWERAVQLV